MALHPLVTVRRLRRLGTTSSTIQVAPANSDSYTEASAGGPALEARGLCLKGAKDGDDGRPGNGRARAKPAGVSAAGLRTYGTGGGEGRERRHQPASPSQERAGRAGQGALQLVAQY